MSSRACCSSGCVRLEAPCWFELRFKVELLSPRHPAVYSPPKSRKSTVGIGRVLLSALMAHGCALLRSAALEKEIWKWKKCAESKIKDKNPTPKWRITSHQWRQLCHLARCGDPFSFAVVVVVVVALTAMQAFQIPLQRHFHFALRALARCAPRFSQSPALMPEKLWEGPPARSACATCGPGASQHFSPPILAPRPSPVFCRTCSPQRPTPQQRLTLRRRLR